MDGTNNNAYQSVELREPNHNYEVISVDNDKHSLTKSHHKSRFCAATILTIVVVLTLLGITFLSVLVLSRYKCNSDLNENILELKARLNQTRQELVKLNNTLLKAQHENKQQFTNGNIYTLFDRLFYTI